MLIYWINKYNLWTGEEQICRHTTPIVQPMEMEQTAEDCSVVKYRFNKKQHNFDHEFLHSSMM